MNARVSADHVQAVVQSVDEEASYVMLDVGGTQLAARLWPGVAPGQAVTVRVRPEDVVLCTERPGPISTRNILPATVVGLRRRPEGVVVTLDAGFPLAALVTRRTVEELGIELGGQLVALMKATAIVPVQDASRRASGPGELHGEASAAVPVSPVGLV